MKVKSALWKASRCGVLLVWLLLSFSLLSTSRGEVGRIDQKKLLWYDDWVTQYPNDSPPGLSIEDPVELKRVRAEMAKQEEERKARIRTDQEILPYLKALFWMHHRHPDNNGAGGVRSLLEAMTLVTGLLESDVADIAAEVDLRIAEPFQGFSSDRRNYLLQMWMPTLAAHFPTRENIDRCVRIMRKSDSIDWYYPKVIGLQIISKIGTADHLECAEQTWQWLEKQRMPLLKGDFTLRYADEAKLLVEAMRVRLATKRLSGNQDVTSLSGEANTFVEAPDSPQILSSPVPEAPSETHRSRPPTINPLWFALCLLLLPAVFLLVRHKP